MSSKEQKHSETKVHSKQRQPKPVSDEPEIETKRQNRPATVFEEAGVNLRSLTPHNVLQLQRRVGNCVVSGLLGARGQGITLAPASINSYTIQRVTEEDIKKRAYFIWINEGRPEGKDKEHYFRAKSELELEEQRTTAEPTVSPPTQSGIVSGSPGPVPVPTDPIIDTSSSPSLPQYEKDEVPRWKNEGGVAEWAKKEYRKESGRTLICSMTPDRKIGSVYLGSEGRIRTTHGAGPQRETHENLTTIQFNINESIAVPEFEKAYPQFKQSEDYWDYFDQWLVKTLKNVTVDNAPAWATLVDGPGTAYDLKKGSPPEDIKLFEIFKKINGEVESWHPSRGTAAKFETDKQTISVLQAAINHIDGKGLVDPKKRNTEFYEFVKSRLPNFIDCIRHPDEVG